MKLDCFVCKLNKLALCFAEPPIGKFAGRRKSVFAETYNPEDDEEDEGVKVKKKYYLRYCLFKGKKNFFKFVLQYKRRREIKKKKFLRGVILTEIPQSSRSSYFNFFYFLSVLDSSTVES